jgi:hypothetical protein
MKKNEAKKLRLSRETLQALKRSDVQEVVGGSVCSSPQTDYCPSRPQDVCDPS